MAPIKLDFPLRMTACGAVTAVGWSSAPTFAAMRAGIAAFHQTHYRTIHGEPIVGAPVPGVEATRLGPDYLGALARLAFAECLAADLETPERRIGLVLGVNRELPAEDGRRLLNRLAKEHRLSDASKLAVSPSGDESLLYGLAQAAEWIANGTVDRCIVGGVDTYLTQRALRELERKGRLKTSRNSDGVIPGEAACFVTVARDDAAGDTARGGVVIRGLGLSGSPSQFARRGDGLTRAMREALAQAGIHSHEVDFRPSNHAGEGALALESGVASMRLYRAPGPYPPAWLPAESVGMVGAAIGALLLGWMAAGFANEYAPGRVALAEFVSADGFQGALVATAG